MVARELHASKPKTGSTCGASQWLLERRLQGRLAGELAADIANDAIYRIRPADRQKGSKPNGGKPPGFP